VRSFFAGEKALALEPLLNHGAREGARTAKEPSHEIGEQARLNRSRAGHQLTQVGKKLRGIRIAIVWLGGKGT
jgi:hypothetical protein